MKIVQVNATCGKGSTGKICTSISDLLTQKNIENYIFYCGTDSNNPAGICYATMPQIKLEALRSHLNGYYGFNSQLLTQKLLRQLDAIQPDIVHLHNLHGHNCNLEMLLRYLKIHRTKVFWTFHDCWAFTAYCPHFTMAKCDRWKSGCFNCPQLHSYSFFFDRSKKLYQKKRDLLLGLDLAIITPSQWLASLVKQSFFRDCPIKVIHNGIDLAVFAPTPSDFREKYHIPDGKFMILGVAFDWGKRKGLDVFVELAARLDSQKYQIVLVGTNDHIDSQLPPQIISIHRTANQKELAEIYTAADLFVNPTREEVFGLVNVEALACGTPVITFMTGGSPECIDDICGAVVDCDDIDTLEHEIIRINETHPFTYENCLAWAKQFDAQKKYLEYLDLYERTQQSG